MSVSVVSVAGSAVTLNRCPVELPVRSNCEGG
jgi:hypothetical protein